MWRTVGLRKHHYEKKLVEVMEFQLSYFKSWNMMLWKCCTPYASKFGKLSSGHRTGKGRFSFQSQIKAMPKNVQITAQLHSSHTLANAGVMLKILHARLQQYINCELPDVQAGFRKSRGTTDQIANICWIMEKQESCRKKNLLLLYLLLPSLWLCGSQETVENSSRDGNTKPPYLPPEKSVCRSRSNS